MKDLIYTVAGTIFGSLMEEGIEEFFPGVGELGLTGEIIGSISGLLTSRLTKDEIRNSIKIFIKYAYKSINKSTATENITDEELKIFSTRFCDLPQNKKKEILNNFKILAPYEYNYIFEFLKELEQQGA